MINSDTHSWAHGLFGGAELGNKRRTNRLVHVANALAKNTGKSLVKSSHSPAEAEGAYRLLRNASVDAERIARAGFESCAKSAQRHSLLLALEDTTTLQYSHKSVHRMNLATRRAGNTGEACLRIRYCYFLQRQRKLSA